MWNPEKALQTQPNNKLATYFWSLGLAVFLLFSNSAVAAFANVDCSNAAHTSTLQIPQAECEALEALWDSTGGAGWTTNTWWDTLNNANSWHGIWASGGHVTRVIPYDNNLVGTIPPQLGNLSMMEYLDLSRNELTGPIPPELGNLSNLTNLVLQFNQLNGSLPPQIGNMTSLVNMRVDNNEFTGSLIPELGNLANLAWLEIHHNQLTGSIPTEFQNLTALSKLQLAVNQLSGRIPDLSSLPLLNSFQMPRNFFVFADVEPEWLSYRSIYFFPQADVDTDRSDNFAAGETLTITPQLTVNPSGNDVYQWRKDGVIIPAPEGTQRIFSKTAEASDAGLYWYSVSNTVVNSGQLNATNTANTGIHITIGEAPPPSNYTVGGTVSALSGNLVLQNNAGDDLTVGANGSFTFATSLADLSPYRVTVSTQPSGQSCSVSNGSGTISGTNVTNVGVDCVDDAVPPVTPPVPATPIPTLSVWALLVLFALLGMVVISNRRHIF